MAARGADCGGGANHYKHGRRLFRLLNAILRGMRHSFSGFVIGVVLLGLLASPVVTWGKTVEELRAELNAKRTELKNAEERISQFRQDIQLKKKEARTLESQIEIMEDTIGQLELTLDKTRAQVEQTAAEIDEVAAEIATTEEELAAQKALLAEYIRGLYALDQQTTVTIFLKYQTFSEVLNEAATFDELHNRAQQTYQSIQALRNELIEKRRDLEDYQATLEALRRRQEQQQAALQSQRDAKERILELTKAQEAKFKDLLAEAQATHKAAESEIGKIDAAIREELRKQGFGNLPSVGTFEWPVNPIFGVSCEFHCTDYPYAYLIGPHAGTDIPVPPGTPIRAPADGYLARLHDSGGRGYSYILMLFGDNLSVVFGHVSGFGDVAEGQLVTQGTVIGYTGGAPGTRGAGLSTGPHLHFEVRKNNVPVNARHYLKAEP